MSHKLQHTQAKIKIILDLGTSPLPLLKLKKCCTVIVYIARRVHHDMSTSKIVQSGTRKKRVGMFLFAHTFCTAHPQANSSLPIVLLMGGNQNIRTTEKKLIFNGILALHMLMISLFSSPVKVSSLYNDAIVKLPFLSSAQATVSGSSCNRTPLTYESKSCHSSISAIPKDLLKVRFTPLSCNTSYTVLFCSLQIM
jgi:hypothetical protein